MQQFAETLAYKYDSFNDIEGLIVYCSYCKEVRVLS